MNEIVTFFEQTGIWGVLVFSLLFLMIFFTVRDYLRFRRITKRHKDHMANLEAKKCKGPHSWIDMEIMGEKTHVCKECCFTPKHDTFVKEHFVKAELEHIKYKKELEEYKSKRMAEICEKYNIEESRAQAISDEVVSIKKDFAIMKLDEALEKIGGKK